MINRPKQGKFPHRHRRATVLPLSLENGRLSAIKTSRAAVPPRISVIIPTYNRQKFVKMSVDSVLCQTFRDFELIIVDDGSTDDTREVLGGYGADIVVIHQDNLGVSGALNTGIRASKGEWIAILGSDDEWLPGYLEQQMEAARLYPEAIAHITNAVTVTLEDGNEDHFCETKLIHRFSKRRHILLKRPLCTVIDHSPWFCQATIMRKDHLVGAGGFDQNLHIAEDLDVISKLAVRGSLSICRDVFVRVIRRRETLENLSARAHRDGIDMYHSFAKVYESLLATPGLRMAERLSLRRALGHAWRALGNAYVRSGSKARARVSYMRSLFAYPSFRSLVKGVAMLFPYGLAILVTKRPEKSNDDGC